MNKFSKAVFWAIITLLPVNLGYHFIITGAYAGGLLIDYLIPTVFVPDLLVALLMVTWLMQKDFPADLKNIITRPYFALTIWFVFLLGLSVLESNRVLPSFSTFIRTFFYTGFMFYVSLKFDMSHDLRVLAKIISVTTLLLGILGVLQYIHQGSLFDNYLILGEQPYSISTPLISKENVFGHTRVPPYGLFRHPNIFGGFLSIYLILILFLKQYLSKKLAVSSFVIGSIALILTLSYFSWASFILGVFTYILKKSGIHIARIAVSTIFLLSFFLPVFNFLRTNQNPSIYRRVNLLDASYKLVRSEYLFGVGINNSIVLLEKNIPWTRDIRFIQPVHNIFVLLFIEAGIFGLLLFVGIILGALKNTFESAVYLHVALLQVCLLGSFDHYFVTIHQTWLLLWLLVGLGFAQIQKNDPV